MIVKYLLQNSPGQDPPPTPTIPGVSRPTEKNEPNAPEELQNNLQRISTYSGAEEKSGTTSQPIISSLTLYYQNIRSIGNKLDKLINVDPFLFNI